ncbi:MAG: hypothetical protein IKP03_10925 [Fibrobacter sp.]|nr:hypothetical protein [Fibrobacter sp.]
MKGQLQKIDYKPEGFAECLSGLTGMVQAEAEKIANKASSMLTNGSGFHVEMTTMPRYRDSSYSVSRPVAHVVANDAESSKEEAEYKILSKAVSG